MQPLVGIIMGSKSDWETLSHAADTLTKLGVPHEVRVVSGPPHAGPAVRIRRHAPRRAGLQVIIAGAGGAAHLPGMAAAKTALPVLGVPVESAVLRGRRFAAVDRADAGRHPGRHAGDRQGRRDQRGTVGDDDSGEQGREVSDGGS